MSKISTAGRITILLGKLQAATGERSSLRSLAAQANVPKDLVYRLDSGQARYIDSGIAIPTVCNTLNCQLQDILTWEKSE
jgi:DNA-binding Xre family transcriptional regulator